MEALFVSVIMVGGTDGGSITSGVTLRKRYHGWRHCRGQYY